MKIKITIFLLAFLLISMAALSAAAEFDSIKSTISEFTLDNGLKFILIEDHSVPVASFVTYANVGSSDEMIGIYGISHFLEHLAFKGTSVIGTTDFAREEKLFKKMDLIFEDLKDERGKIEPDPVKTAKLESELEGLKNEASKFVVPNEFTNTLKKHGTVGLNAGTGADLTTYYFSLPSNKLELWAYLESSRFKDPVFREFYKERQVIKEERRTTTDNKPIGKCIEEFLSIAFKDQPYRNSVIGPESNINNISRADVRNYFNRFYTGRNMVIGVSGDVSPAELKAVAVKYFAAIPAGRRMNRNITIDTPQSGEKRMVLNENSQPWLLIGYHCPSMVDQDFKKIQLLKYVISEGRSSRLQKKLVIKDRSAMHVGSFAGFPGDKYPGMYLIYTLANSGHSNDSIENEIFGEMDTLRTSLISDEELISAKNRMKIDLLRQYENDMDLLSDLLKFEMVTGKWENCFSSYYEIDGIKASDIQDVVKKYMSVNNRVIVKIESKKESAQ